MTLEGSKVNAENKVSTWARHWKAICHAWICGNLGAVS